MNSVTSLKKGLALVLSAIALVVLSACGGNVSAPAKAPSTSLGQGFLLTVKVSPQDLKAALEQKFGGKAIAWQPSAGFAILQLSNQAAAQLKSSGVSLQDVTLEANQPVQSPELQAQGSSAWAGGWNAWAGGWNAWAGGWSAWAGGINAWAGGSTYPAELPANNRAAWLQIGLYQAHALSRNFGAGVKVAVIDTGIDLNHPIFQGHLTPSNEWYDFIGDDGYPQDITGGKFSGHGTAVAGLILQVAPQATILPIRVLNSDGGGDIATVVSAISYAISDGAQIINLSVGANTDSNSLHTISAYAKQMGVYIVASAGNDGKKDGITAPARYSWSDDTKGYTFGIGSVDANDMLSSFSNYGSALYATAPGEKLFSSFPGNQVANATGTSFAAPLVTGALALAYSELTNPADNARLQTFLWSSLDFSINQKNANKTTNVQRLNVANLIRSLPGFTLPTQIKPGVYNLVNTNSGKCLDVAGNSTANGGNVDISTCNGSTNQKWLIETVGNNYKLTSVNSSKVLEVSGGSTKPGANIQQWNYWGGLNQQWLIQPNGSNYQLVSPNSNLCLDVYNFGTNDGTNVQQWSCTGSGAQQWQLLALF
ncbi:MAG: RICIN domain-containing protein [Thermaceae bacterium]|nr:RICIN domain-containing protein [Thermaceae bacterium]